MNRLTVRALILTAALLTLSCASPMRMTDNWKSSTYKGPSYKKVMVVAMTRHAELRKPIEGELARQLRSRGVEATACHEVIPDPDKGSREELLRLGRERGIEAYLVMQVLKLGSRVQSYPTPHGAYPSGPATGTDSMVNLSWFGADPGMVKRSEVATLDSRLYDGKSLDIVWRSTVDAVDPYGSDEQISRFAGMNVKALRAHRLIP